MGYTYTKKLFFISLKFKFNQCPIFFFATSIATLLSGPSVVLCAQHPCLPLLVSAPWFSSGELLLPHSQATLFDWGSLHAPSSIAILKGERGWPRPGQRAAFPWRTVIGSGMGMWPKTNQWGPSPRYLQESQGQITLLPPELLNW